MATTKAPSIKPMPPHLSELSCSAQWAAFAIRSDLGKIQGEASGGKYGADRDHIFPTPETLSSPEFQPSPFPTPRRFHVGIIGAGVAGLFTAMIFDKLKEMFGLNVHYEILEANIEDRLGGRLYSYYFKDIVGQPRVGPHDYYDVGAMRFPNNAIMGRTFQLFNELSMRESPPNRPPQKGDLIPYHLSGRNQPLLYNNIQVVLNNAREPTANDFKIPGLPEEIINQGAGKLVSDKIKKFIDEYKNKGPKAFWKLLMGEADDYSVRQYLTQKARYNYNTIEFLETLNYGNRWYDQALSEMIIESLDFDADRASWRCIEGGSQEIARRMWQKLQQQQAVQFGKSVIAMSYVGEKWNRKINVTVKGEENLRTYDAVFNSAPLGAMQHMQLEGLNLNWGTKSAIRSLGYGASCKIGVRFKKLWWIRDLNIDGGGQARTDLPVRCCVYPSYNIKDPVDEPGVLLVSYSWSQEAGRIGALISRESPQGEEKLKDVLIHDLARLHAKTQDERDYRRLHKIISDEYLSHYAYDWYASEHSVGAFAYFGPGQFRNMYPWITRNDGKHIIIGEAASAHHAWVVGALESAVRGVYQFLFRHSYDRAAFDAAWAYATNSVPGPYGPIPSEFSLTRDIELLKGNSENPPSPIGDLARLQVVAEMIRLEQGGDEIKMRNVTEEQVAPLLGMLGGMAIQDPPS